MNVRTRFAPSPTGFMHVGGVRTALFAWLFARKHGGQFILRIEDTDKEREVEGSTIHIIECLKWLGIEWDEGVDIGGPHAPYLQSERLDSYKKYAQQLIGAGHAYPDPYTQEELEAFRTKAEEEKRPFLFRDHRPTEFGAWDGTQPLRFKVPEVKRYTWNDLVRGELSAGEEALDDFILIKADGYPTYNFAHIIDDLEMGITHIMRGEEFISSTPKFLSLYEALGITRPEIATMPVILGPDGKKKLSKRDGAKDILEYKAEGYLPHAMVNFLALLGWHPEGDQELLSLEELTSAFDFSHVQKGGAKLDEDKLRHINQHWMRALTDEEYLAQGNFEGYDPAMLLKAVPLIKERSQTFKEAKEMLLGELSGLFAAPTLNKEMLVAKEPDDRPGITKPSLEAVLGALEALQEGVSVEEVKERIMPVADAEEAKGKGGRGAVLWPLRYALSGQERSPDPFTLVSLLGPAESASRVRTALGIL
ncbi:MAG: gltX [Parcubacteria group bacterium]|nr:gltX [Parcubacteria group bacterium]